MFRTQSRIAVFSVAAVALALPSLASAAETQSISASSYGETVSVNVPIDILETDDGAAKLYKALEKRAEAACKRTIPRALGRTVRESKCEADLMDGFVSDLNHDALTAMHASKTS